MDKQARPLEEFFEAARREPGISEAEVRSIVRDGARDGGRAARRWLMASLGAAGALAIAIGIALDGTPESSSTNSSATVTASTLGDGAADTAARNRTNATAQPISPEETMNTRNFLRNAAVAAIATTAITADSLAQETPRDTKFERRVTGERRADGDASNTRTVEKKVTIQTNSELDPLMEKMAAELGRQAAEFWTARLNSYKTRIDRTLAPSELEKLNRLRVRFGVMVAKADLKADLRTGTLENEEDVQVRTEEHVVNGDGTTDRKIERHITIDANMGSPSAMEFFDLHRGAQGLASAHRSEMDALAKDVLADAVTFIRTIKSAADVFVASNRVAIERTEDGKELAMELDEADDIVKALDDPATAPMIQMVYASFLEPLIMLYDGTDLNNFFQNAGPLASAVTGYKLPETSALQQNVPNPAAGTTTITYKLEEPSSATTLRLFDATGTLVGTYDQGARDAGAHSATIDLSSLPNGTYLYHLTVSGPGGERVYSKAMQVAR